MLKINKFTTPSKRTHAAVIVETRTISNLKDIIDGHMKWLRGWSLFIFHSDANYHLVKNIPGQKINIRRNLSRDSYSSLLCTKAFWLQIPHEKILIFQHDSMLLKAGIESFLRWDWVGGPSWWQGYNGGLSLRSRSKMIAVVEKCRYAGDSEDMYFHRNIKRVGGSIAPIEVARKFCCEAHFHLGTLGYHGIHNFLQPTEINKIKNQYSYVGML